MPLISWFDRSTVRHLRLPFSFFLLPVYLFALSQAKIIDWHSTWAGFIILHFLVFPSTNGYNSYQDRDETSIGGLKHPPQVNSHLFWVTLLFDIIAVTGGLFISMRFSVMVLIFITMSRLYSFRGIRLKKYPIIAFIIVFIFQGAFVYLMASESIFSQPISNHFSYTSLLCMAISSFFIGSMYPLTQIYQHEADKKDGVISLSYLLGYRGTFLFSGMLFSLATFLLFFHLFMEQQLLHLILFIFFLLPVTIRLARWFSSVRKDKTHANYENTMALNLLSSVCMNLYFITLVINNQTSLFR